MKLLFDTSVWVDHLRQDALAGVLPRLRGRYQLSIIAIVAAELLAGCRSRIERRVVEGLIAPFRKAGRLVTVGDLRVEAFAVPGHTPDPPSISRGACCSSATAPAALSGNRVGQFLVERGRHFRAFRPGFLPRGPLRRFISDTSPANPMNATSTSSRSMS